MMKHVHTVPFGTAAQPDGGTRFALFAPAASRIQLAIDWRHFDATKDVEGSCRLIRNDAPAGPRCRWIVDNELTVPEPASPSNLNGPHARSEVIDPWRFLWQHDWQGRSWHETVVYELNVGTFAHEGTFAAAALELPRLAELGVTAVQLMPVASCGQAFGWGYDGVLLYAPTAAYDSPDDLKLLVDTAHGLVERRLSSLPSRAADGRDQVVLRQVQGRSDRAARSRLHAWLRARGGGRRPVQPPASARCEQHDLCAQFRQFPAMSRPDRQPRVRGASERLGWCRRRSAGKRHAAVPAHPHAVHGRRANFAEAFLYFADPPPEMREGVRAGRREELSDAPDGEQSRRSEPPGPFSRQTFDASVIEPFGVLDKARRDTLAWTADLLALRRQKLATQLPQLLVGEHRFDRIGGSVLRIEWFFAGGHSLAMTANLSGATLSLEAAHEAVALTNGDLLMRGGVVRAGTLGPWSGEWRWNAR